MAIPSTVRFRRANDTYLEKCFRDVVPDDGIGSNENQRLPKTMRVTQFVRG